MQINYNISLKFIVESKEIFHKLQKLPFHKVTKYQIKRQEIEKSYKPKTKSLEP